MLHEVELGSNRKCAEVCCIKNPTNFWVRLEDQKDDYLSMVNQLQAEYNTSDSNKLLTTSLLFISFLYQNWYSIYSTISRPHFEPKHFIVGSTYCTFNQRLYEWHRCEILRVNERDALVFFTDIGAKDLVPIKSLKILKVNYT